MRLGFILLDNVSDVNNFKEVKELTITEGNPGTLYFRIIQLDKGEGDDGETALRFIPPVGATAQVLFDSLNDENDLDLVAAQPFSADDRSIWSVALLAGYKLGPNGMTVKLTFGGNTYTLEAATEFRQSPTGNNRFFC